METYISSAYCAVSSDCDLVMQKPDLTIVEVSKYPLRRFEAPAYWCEFSVQLIGLLQMLCPDLFKPS
jgi:hypothetical protein